MSSPTKKQIKDPKQAEKEKAEKELEAKRKAEQEEIRLKVIQEQIQNDPVRVLASDLEKEKETIEDPLEFPKIVATQDEWSNIPQIVAKYCINTQAHLEACIAYLKKRSYEETTYSLRNYVETENKHQDKLFFKYREKSTKEITELFSLDQKINTYVKTIDKELLEIRQNIDLQGQDTLKELFSYIQDESLFQNDNFGQGIENEKDILKFGTSDIQKIEQHKQKILEEAKAAGRHDIIGDFSNLLFPNINIENNLLKPRMFTFKQLYQLNNLCLNKSFLRKRTKVSEDNISVLQSEVIELQNWRKDIEQRMDDRFKSVDDHFDQNLKEFNEYKDQVQSTFDGKEEHLTLHDTKIKQIFATLLANQADREELHRQCQYLGEKMTDNQNAIEKKLQERYTKLLDKQNYAEKEINQSIQLLSKELEKLKYELSDVIDQKFDHITRNLETQTQSLRKTFDELNASLSSTSLELNTSFKDKLHTIKALCATFFAKIDTNINENNKKVEKIQLSHNQFEANFVNPAKEIDAKVFSMDLKIQNADRERESQFNLLNDSLRQLIYALESQNSGSFNSIKNAITLILQNQFNEGSPGILNGQSSIQHLDQLSGSKLIFQESKQDLSKKNQSSSVFPSIGKKQPLLVNQISDGHGLIGSSFPQKAKYSPNQSQNPSIQNSNLGMFNDQKNDHHVLNDDGTPENEIEENTLVPINKDHDIQMNSSKMDHLKTLPDMNQHLKKQNQMLQQNNNDIITLSQSGLFGGQEQKDEYFRSTQSDKNLQVPFMSNKTMNLSNGNGTQFKVNNALKKIDSKSKNKKSFARNNSSSINNSINKTLQQFNPSSLSVNKNSGIQIVNQARIEQTHSKSKINLLQNQSNSILSNQIQSFHSPSQLQQELKECNIRVQQEAQLFQKRLHFIKKQLDLQSDIEPVKQISRDHSRTNRNGIKLDYLEAKGERYVPMPEDLSYFQNPFRKQIEKGQAFDGNKYDRSGIYTPRARKSPNKFDGFSKLQQGSNQKNFGRKFSHQPGGLTSMQQINRINQNRDKHQNQFSEKNIVDNGNSQLPEALGKSLTPSHIKIQQNNTGSQKSHLYKIQNKSSEGNLSPIEKQIIYQGSSQNPDNIGLQTSPVKILNINQQKVFEKEKQQFLNANQLQIPDRNSQMKPVKPYQSTLENNLKKNKMINQNISNQRQSNPRTHLNQQTGIGMEQQIYKNRVLPALHDRTYDKMADTLGMKSFGPAGVTRMTGQTIGLYQQNSESTSKFDNAPSHIGNTPTPSIMSPIKHGTGIGLIMNENTLYSVSSPNNQRIINMINKHDPVRAIDENIKEQQEIYEKKLQQKKMEARRR